MPAFLLSRGRRKWWLRRKRRRPSMTRFGNDAPMRRGVDARFSPQNHDIDGPAVIAAFLRRFVQ
jgi:hypothetical protein